jgi:hypothetical protein
VIGVVAVDVGGRVQLHSHSLVQGDSIGNGAGGIGRASDRHRYSLPSIRKSGQFGSVPLQV